MCQIRGDGEVFFQVSWASLRNGLCWGIHGKGCCSRWVKYKVVLDLHTILSLCLCWFVGVIDYGTNYRNWGQILVRYGLRICWYYKGVDIDRIFHLVSAAMIFTDSVEGGAIGSWWLTKLVPESETWLLTKEHMMKNMKYVQAYLWNSISIYRKYNCLSCLSWLERE